MIEIDRLSKSYGAKEALRGISLEIRPGEVFTFLGPNGAGKTTTMKLIAGLLRPSSGTARICGHDVVTDFLAAKALLGYVPDEPYVYEKLTGREFLRFVGSLRGLERSVVERRAQELSETFETTDYIDELTGGYSHGMKQRVVISAALMGDPKALIVDEPMVGLDPKAARIVKDMLRRRADSGVAVFVSTHTLPLAEEIADRIGIISGGRIVALGSIDELRELAHCDGRMEDLFLSLTCEEDPPGASPGSPSPRGAG